MVVFLKILGFSIWMTIMLVLIGAVRRTPRLQIREVTVRVADQDDAEEVVKKALRQLKKKTV